MSKKMVGARGGGEGGQGAGVQAGSTLLEEDAVLGGPEHEEPWE